MGVVGESMFVGSMGIRRYDGGEGTDEVDIVCRPPRMEGMQERSAGGLGVMSVIGGDDERER